MWRWAARFGGVLAGVLALGTVPSVTAVQGAVRQGAVRQAAVVVVVQGVSVEIVELPDRFVAGAPPATVTVVAAKASGGCLKVRWSMVLQLEGLTLEQVRVDRIEENGSFPVDVEDNGGTARITDEQLDPGTLCRDRTVTARYRLNVANDVLEGRLTVRAEAYDARLQLLERASATRSIVGAAAPPASREPAGDAGTDAPSADAGPAAGDGASGATEPTDAPVDQATAGNDQNGLPIAWFLIGGLMMFLGVSLLLNVRLRHRNRPEPVPATRLSRYRTVPRRARGW